MHDLSYEFQVLRHQFKPLELLFRIPPLQARIIILVLYQLEVC